MTGLKQNPAYEPADFFKNRMHNLNAFIVCPFCGWPGKVVWVHGHGQCVRCHTVLDECCRGESAPENLTLETPTTDTEPLKTDTHDAQQTENPDLVS